MSPMVKLPLTLEHALLGFLWKEPMHAYEMHQALKEARELGLIWHLKQSQLYALLARLEEAGYIATVTEPQGTRPPRKVMHLTPAGRDAFQLWMRTPVEHGRDFRQEFLAKLYFARADGAATVTALVELQAEECRNWLVGLQTRAAATPQDSFDWLVLQFRIGQVQAILAWLDACATTVSTEQT